MTQEHSHQNPSTLFVICIHEKKHLDVQAKYHLFKRHFLKNDTDSHHSRALAQPQDSSSMSSFLETSCNRLEKDLHYPSFITLLLHSHLRWKGWMWKWWKGRRVSAWSKGVEGDVKSRVTNLEYFLLKFFLHYGIQCLLIASKAPP